jgi:type II secretory pathway component PulJ
VILLNRNININEEAAFTLIEVIISIVLITLILGVLFNLNLSVWRFFNFNQDSLELSQQATLIAANINQNIRNAVYIDASNDQLKLYSEIVEDENLEKKENFFRYRIDNDQLVLDKPTSDVSGFSDETDFSSISWVKERNIIQAKIKKDSFEVNEDNSLVDYSLVLKNNNDSLVVEYYIKSRLKK